MQITFRPARLTGFAIVAVAAATALSVGACSKSDNAKSPATSSPASGTAVYGLVASVSGDTVQVNQATGTATVDVSPSTKVIENSRAQLTDIAAGNCVKVLFNTAPPAGGPVTATIVQMTMAGGNGKCPQPKAVSPHGVAGTVASVDGNTIHVTVTDANGNPAQKDVTVTDKTYYSKDSGATSQAIEEGKCIAARGSKDGSGTLHATLVGLSPANNGKCPAAPKK
jgi:uncharacterized protein DUF5666